MFDADEALAGGLVRTVCPVAEVLPLARQLAHEIGTNAAPVSAVITRHLLWQMLGADHPMVTHRIDSRAIYDTGRMADAAEGVAAFLGKRPANWALAPSDGPAGLVPVAVRAAVRGMRRYADPHDRRQPDGRREYRLRARKQPGGARPAAAPVG